MPHRGPKDWVPGSGDQVRKFRQRVLKAMDAAKNAFWAELAKEFRGDFSTGDLPADISSDLDNVNKDAVYWWLYFNHPDSDLVQEAFRKLGNRP